MEFKSKRNGKSGPGDARERDPVRSAGFPFTRRQWFSTLGWSLVFGIAIALFAPKHQRGGGTTQVDAWAVSVVLLSGGYVVLRSRSADIDFYRSQAGCDEATERRLRRRYRLLGVVGWLFVGVGGFRVLLLLVQAFGA